MEVCLQYHARGQQVIQDQTGGQGPEGFAGSKGHTTAAKCLKVVVLLFKNDLNRDRVEGKII